MIETRGPMLRTPQVHLKPAASQLVGLAARELHAARQAPGRALNAGRAGPWGADGQPATLQSITAAAASQAAEAMAETVSARVAATAAATCTMRQSAQPGPMPRVRGWRLLAGL